MKQEVKNIQNRNTDELNRSNSNTEVPEYFLNDEQLAELQEFCQTFNPYEELSLESKLRLQEYGVESFENPFEVTNKLLLLLENNLQFRNNAQ